MSPDPVTVASVAGRPTQQLCLTAEGADTLVLIVPGNPGAARFYVPFARQLFAAGGGRWHVAAAGHLGQVPPLPPPEGQGHFTLDDQIQHKLDFLQGFPDVQTVHLVGHSIGAWIALGIFDRLPAARRGRAVMVCPTLERMAASPNGQRMTPLFNRYRRFGVALARVIHWAPGRRTLLRRRMLRGATPAHHGPLVRAMLDLTPQSIDNVLGMAAEEMRDVVDLPAERMRAHGRRLCLLYAPEDPWVLPGMVDEVEARDLGVEIVRAPGWLRHSFVLHDIEPVVALVSEKLGAHGARVTPTMEASR